MTSHIGMSVHEVCILMLFTKWYPVRALITLKNWTILRPRYEVKYEVEVKFENSMHNYNATLVHWHHKTTASLVHWHHTLGCQCRSLYTYAVHKVVPVRALNAKKLNYFTTSLRGKNEVEVKFENSMHNYNASLVHWHHTLGCQCSSFGTYAVHKVGPVKQSKPYWRTDGQTEIINLIVGLVTRNPPKNHPNEAHATPEKCNLHIHWVYMSPVNDFTHT